MVRGGSLYPVFPPFDSVLQFLVSSRMSDRQHLRAKEEFFCSLAKQEMDRAVAAGISNMPHIFDALRAGSLISMFKFSQDKALEVSSSLAKSQHWLIVSRHRLGPWSAKLLSKQQIP